MGEDGFVNRMTRRQSARRLGVALLAGATALLPAACIRPLLNVGKVIEGVASDSVALNLVLIGDAGLPAPAGEPVMQALKREIEGDPERTFVVYLGDNIYPRGMVDSTDAERDENERILDGQLEPLLETGTRGIFVPGNHDWAAGGPQGWQAMRRQQAYIAEKGGDLVRLVPQNGCPGPVVLDFDDYLRLIVLDTQWWLQGEGPALKPYGRTSPCRSRTEQDVVDSMRVDLATAGTRRTVVVAHHPLVSGGEHGGYFDWPTYLFPLHPVARLGGIFARQDVSGREYRIMIRDLDRAFAAAPPLVYASGHEHNLQVLRERSIARHLLISGGGIYNHTTPVRAITGSQYARRASGWMRLTFLVDGRVRLSVQVVDAAGQAHEDYSAWLETERIRRAPGTGANASPAPSPAPSPP